MTVYVASVRMCCLAGLGPSTYGAEAKLWNSEPLVLRSLPETNLVKIADSLTDAIESSRSNIQAN